MRYLFVSPAYAEMLGCPAAEIAGKSIPEVMGSKDSRPFSLISIKSSAAKWWNTN
jgi:PAS domain-containing protein